VVDDSRDKRRVPRRRAADLTESYLANAGLDAVSSILPIELLFGSLFSRHHSDGVLRLLIAIITVIL
jgi:hypothetical protein